MLLHICFMLTAKSKRSSMTSCFPYKASVQSCKDSGLCDLGHWAETLKLVVVFFWMNRWMDLRGFKATDKNSFVFSLYTKELCNLCRSIRCKLTIKVKLNKIEKVLNKHLTFSYKSLNKDSSGKSLLSSGSSRWKF